MRAEDSNPCSLVVRDLLCHRNLAMTGRYVNRSNRPVRTLSDQVGGDDRAHGRRARRQRAFNALRYDTSLARSCANSASLIDPAFFSRSSFSISSAALKPTTRRSSSRASCVR